MSSGRRLYPRLARPVAEACWQEIYQLSVEELVRSASASHPNASYAATGGTRVREEDLNILRTSILDLARALGFPEPGGRAALATFDAKAAAALYESMGIGPGEASREEVWSFIGLVLMPDVARWRFPGSGQERFRGGPSQRNTFQRLWWRAHVLQDPRFPDPFHLLQRLPEDALVGIMERPGISSNPRLARAIAREAVAIDERVAEPLREDLRRDAFKRVRQRIPVLAIDALEAPQIEAVVQDAFAAAVRGAIGERDPDGT